MRNEIRQHVPASVDVGQPPTYGFETLEQLLEIPFVKQWKEMPNFTEYALAEDLLMGVLDDGFTWWVIGYVKYPKQLKLPRWEPKRKGH